MSITQSFPLVRSVGVRVFGTCEATDCSPASLLTWRRGKEGISHGDAYHIDSQTTWTGMGNLSRTVSILSFVARDDDIGKVFSCVLQAERPIVRNLQLVSAGVLLLYSVAFLVYT
jgi:hypothetical protein